MRSRLLAVSFGVLLMLLCPRARAQDDAWFGRDKWLHFGVSAALAGGGYAGSALVWDEPWQRAAAGAAIALGAGAAKELYDASAAGQPSLKDLTWDLVGALVGVAIAYGIDAQLDRADEPPVQLGSRGMALRF